MKRKRIRLKRGGWRRRTGEAASLRDRLIGASIGAPIGTVLFPAVIALLLWRNSWDQRPPPFEEYGYVAAVAGALVMGLAGFLAGTRMRHTRAQLAKLGRELLKARARFPYQEFSPRTRSMPGDAIPEYSADHAEYDAGQVVHALAEGQNHPCIRSAPDVVLLVAASHPNCRIASPEVKRQRVAQLYAALERAVEKLDDWERVEGHSLLVEFRGRGAVVCRPV